MYYKLDITPYINYARSIGKEDITLVLVQREQQKDAGISLFHARENRSGKIARHCLENTQKTGIGIPATGRYHIIQKRQRFQRISISKHTANDVPSITRGISHVAEDINNIIFANKIMDGPGQENGIQLNPMIKLPENITNWEGLDKMGYFRVQPGSPAIDAGMKIDNTVTKDYNGTPVPNNSKTDIGAFEFATQPE